MTRAEHVPGKPTASNHHTGTVVRCQRCGLLLWATDEPGLDPDRLPCRDRRTTRRAPTYTDR